MAPDSRCFYTESPPSIGGVDRCPDGPLPAPEPEFLTVEEAAAGLRVNRKTLLSAIRRQEIPGVQRIGRTIRLHWPTVLSFFTTGQGRGPARGRR